MSWVKQQQVWKGERLGRTGFGVLVEEACVRSSSCERLQVSPVQSCLATRILHHAANGSHLSSPFSMLNQTEPLLFSSRSQRLSLSHLCLHTLQATQFRRRLDLHCSLLWPPIQCNLFARHPVCLPAGGE
jgi:hypothetical protein